MSTTTSGFEYHDHTADVQICAWGPQLEDAYVQAALGMYNILTPITALDSDVVCTFEASGHDDQSLLYAFLDECLFRFHVEFIVCSSLETVDFNRETWSIKAEGKGTVFDPKRHERGTEVKAITYSAMKIGKREEMAEVKVIVDI